MPRHVTIVMYHYVRELRRSRYPAIAGIDAGAFAGQLAHLLKHHHLVRMEDVIAATLDPSHDLPPNATLLTFDDGYVDHFHTVFPLLDRLGLQGSFYVPARPIVERRVLDVNKIHFLLAAAPDPRVVVRAMEAHVEAGREEHDLATIGHYRDVFSHANRWDTADVIYVKRMLQRGLPQPLRATIADALFREFVSDEEATFAEELYVSMEQLRCMLRHGMHIGAHGYDHVWLDALGPMEQEQEVRASLGFLRAIGCDLDAWTMSYPYGGFDADVLDIVAAHGCRIGLTTAVAAADLDRDAPLALPRIDTNDLPRHEHAPRSAWAIGSAAS